MNLLRLSTNWTFVVGVMFLGCLIIAWQGWRGWRLARRAPQSRPLDISHLTITPPPEIHALIATLDQLGFTRLGEIQTTLFGKEPSTPPITLSTSADRPVSWIFVDPEGTTVAQIVPGGSSPTVAFTSAFDAPLAFLQTIYPEGEAIDTPTLQVHPIKTDLSAAYQQHRAQFTRFQAMHGVPRRITTMDAHLYWDHVLSERYATRYLRRLTRPMLIQLLVGVYGLTVVVTMVLLTIAGNSPQSIDTVKLLLNLLAPAVFIYLINGFVAKLRLAKPSRR